MDAEDLFVEDNDYSNDEDYAPEQPSHESSLLSNFNNDASAEQAKKASVPVSTLAGEQKELLQAGNANC